MKRGGIFIYISLVILSIIIFSSLTSAATRTCWSCGNCTAEIGNASAGDVVQLNQSVNISGICMTSAKNNITFDCQNYSNFIQGDGSAASYGIYLNSVNNNTITNCNISQFDYGIYLSSSSNNTLTNITANNNTSYGIYLSSSNNNVLINMAAYRNSIRGVYLSSSSNNTLTNITTNSNTVHGTILSNSNNNTLTNITANSNTNYGIALSSSSNNILKYNNMSNNSYNFMISGVSNQEFNNTIDLSNIIDYSYKIYYNYSISNYVFDSITASNAGTVYCAYCNNVTVKNLNLSHHNFHGVYFFNTTNSTIRDLVSTSNYYGIYLDLNSNKNNLINITSNSNSYGIQLYQSSNNFLQNITTTLNSGNYGIYLYPNSNNNFLSNIIANFNFFGVFLLSNSNNNTLTNITANSNANYGIYVQYNSNNILTNITAILNSVLGVSIADTSNTNLTNIIANNNTGYGIFIVRSNNSRLTNITANYNSPYGIYLLTSSNNTFTNLTTNDNPSGFLLSSSNYSVLTGLTTKNNNQYGIAIQGGSYYNIITNSFIQYNNVSGLLLNSSGTAPQYNQFYNNYFNNSVPFSNISAVSTNFFNMSKTLGTNIVGGAYLGGNYWAALNGTGFSQTCTSSTNGICDTAYNLDGLNYDYLPLTCTESWSCGAWSSCSGNVQTRTCSDANSCQTYKYQPITSQSCTTSGSSPPASSPPTETFSVVSPSQPAVMTINNPNVGITQITVNVNTTISNASLTVTPLSNTTGADFRVSLRRGALYQAYQITTIINNSDITNVTINFKVNATWLANQNGTTSNIRLYRYYNNKWTALLTNYLNQDNLYYYFSALSPGFSTFVVFFGEYDCNPNEIRCFNNEVQLCLGNSTWLVTEQCANLCKNGKCINNPINTFFNSVADFLSYSWIYIGIIIVLILGVILLSTRKKGRKIRKIKKQLQEKTEPIINNKKQPRRKGFNRRQIRDMVKEVRNLK